MKYQDLIGQINANINTNGNHGITGLKLNSALNAMISTLGDGFRIAGNVIPQSEAPTDPENGLCYIAKDSGVYTNFSNINVHDNELAILYYNGEAWRKMGWNRKDFGLVIVDRTTSSSFGEEEMDEIRKNVAFIIRNDADNVKERLFVKDRNESNLFIFYSAPKLYNDNNGDLVVNQGVIYVSEIQDEGRYPYEVDKFTYDVPTNENLVSALSQKQDVLSFDSKPTIGSNNPVTSGGVYSAIANIGRIPTISTDIEADATSDTKTASPKAVKTFVEGKGYGTYSKPSGGIPETDMSVAVQTSLSKADTALQSYTETDPTVPAWAKQQSKPTYTAQEVGALPSTTVIPTVPAISTDIESDAASDTKTASPKAVKTFVEGKGYGTYSKPSGGIPASDLESGVIPTVPTISTDIETDKATDAKTASPKAVYDEVHPVVGSAMPQGGMLPNVLYNLGTLSGSVTIALATPSDNTIENEYKFTFNADSTAPTITWPASVTKWIGNSLDNNAPKVDASEHYECSIISGYGIFNKF